MIILTIILATIVIPLIGVLIAVFTIINDVDPKDLVERYFENNHKEKYKGALLVTVIENQGFEGVSYDFSTYDRNHMIGVTLSLIGKHADYDDYRDEEDNIPPFVLPEQTVYLMKDGSYIWDFRKFM